MTTRHEREKNTAVEATDYDDVLHLYYLEVFHTQSLVSLWDVGLLYYEKLYVL